MSCCSCCRWSIIAVTASVVDDPGDLERSFSDWLSNLPGFLDFLWEFAYDLVQVWVLVVGVLALVRRRWGLLRDWAISIAVAIGGVVLVGWLVNGEVPTLSDSIGAADGAGGFPSLALAAGAAAVAVASPYFVSPLRTFGRWLIATAWLSTLVLGVTQPGAGLCALAIGWTAGALVHLVSRFARRRDDAARPRRSAALDRRRCPTHQGRSTQRSRRRRRSDPRRSPTRRPRPRTRLVGQPVLRQDVAARRSTVPVAATSPSIGVIRSSTRRT